MHNVFSRLVVYAHTAALCTILSGCFYYNSEWGESKRSQKRNAAHATPATLAAGPEEGTASRPATDTRTMRVRVYATPPYVSQTLDWQRQARELVEDANRTLIPMLGVRLEIERIALWTPTASEDNLEATLASLRAYDEGGDVDWVLGMIGGLPRVTPSFHQVGMGEMVGKHLVVRAAARIEDHEAIEKSFDELDESERVRLERERKQHRAVAVLLHEIGHTLGALHEREPHSFMHAEYNPKMGGISAEGLAPRGGGTKALAPSETVERPADAPRVAENVPELRPDDRDRYRRALDAWKRGDVQGASDIAQPLFSAYPNTFAVQDMRCQLAMARGQAWSKTSAECEAIVRLTTKH